MKKAKTQEELDRIARADFKQLKQIDRANPDALAAIRRIQKRQALLRLTITRRESKVWSLEEERIRLKNRITVLESALKSPIPTTDDTEVSYDYPDLNDAALRLIGSPRVGEAKGHYIDPTRANSNNLTSVI
ncbi:MAG TPA: hypothetical protein DCG72_06330 [Gammaproteobacteria bacterium]|nr:hypothetical protein [Gammaproteobacteria bacterium]